MTETMKKLLERAKDLRRGCQCDYDYRCGRCQAVLDVQDLAEKVEQEQAGAAEVSEGGGI